MRILNQNGHEIWNQDNLQFMRDRQSNEFDLVLTDPPYNINLDYTGEVLSTTKRMDINKAVKSLSHVKRLVPPSDLTVKPSVSRETDASWDDNMTDNEYFQAMRERAWEIRRVLKPGRWFVFTMEPQKVVAWDTMLQGLRFVPQGMGAWVKPSQMNGSSAVVAKGVMVPAWEAVLFYTKGPSDFKVFDGAGRLPNAWVAERPDNVAHPAARPLKMWQDLLTAFTRPGEVVFDPWLGSGTTTIVAEAAGRKSKGVELNRKLASDAVKRVQRVATGQAKLEV